MPIPASCNIHTFSFHLNLQVFQRDVERGGKIESVSEQIHIIAKQYYCLCWHFQKCNDARREMSYAAKIPTYPTYIYLKEVVMDVFFF